MHQVNHTMVAGRVGRGMATANGPVLAQHLQGLLLAPRLCQGQQTLLAAMATVAAAPALVAVAVAAAAATEGRSERHTLAPGWMESGRGREWQCMQTGAGGWLDNSTVHADQKARHVDNIACCPVTVASRPCICRRCGTCGL